VKKGSGPSRLKRLLWLALVGEGKRVKMTRTGMEPLGGVGKATNKKTVNLGGGAGKVMREKRREKGNQLRRFSDSSVFRSKQKRFREGCKERNKRKGSSKKREMGTRGEKLELPFEPSGAFGYDNQWINLKPQMRTNLNSEGSRGKGKKEKKGKEKSKGG